MSRPVPALAGPDMYSIAASDGVTFTVARPDRPKHTTRPYVVLSPAGAVLSRHASRDKAWKAILRSVAEWHAEQRREQTR